MYDDVISIIEEKSNSKEFLFLCGISKYIQKLYTAQTNIQQITNM